MNTSPWRSSKLWLILATSSAIYVATSNWLSTEGTEFSGGIVTGPLLHLFELGIGLLVLGLMVSFFAPRIAAPVTVLASFLCLPFYLYFIAPGPFRWVFRGEYKAPLQGNFVWANSEVLGLLTLLFTIFVAGTSAAQQPVKESD